MPVGKPGFGKALELLSRLKIASDRKRTRASSDVLAFVRLQLQAHRNAIDLCDCRTDLNGGCAGDDLVGVRFCRDLICPPTIPWYLPLAEAPSDISGSLHWSRLPWLKFVASTPIRSDILFTDLHSVQLVILCSGY